MFVVARRAALVPSRLLCAAPETLRLVTRSSLTLHPPAVLLATGTCFPCFPCCPCLSCCPLLWPRLLPPCCCARHARPTSPSLLQLYGVSLRLARDVYETLDAFLTRHPPEVVYAVSAPHAVVLGWVGGWVGASGGVARPGRLHCAAARHCLASPSRAGAVAGCIGLGVMATKCPQCRRSSEGPPPAAAGSA